MRAWAIQFLEGILRELGWTPPVERVEVMVPGPVTVAASEPSACEYCAAVSPGVIAEAWWRVKAWEARADVGPEYKRHQVYAALLKSNPDIAPSVIARAIERAVYEVRR